LLCRRVISRFALAGAVALAVGGCSNQAQIFDSSNWFSKPTNVFAKPDWARPVDQNTAELGPRGPVGPNDLVNPDGSCAAAEAPQAAASAPEAAPATTGSADPAAGQPGAPPVLGGIALGMTECDAVRRAGTPSNVAISAGDKGERKVVLTYLSGTWPGIYTFDSGRLKVVDRAPEQQKPKAPVKKKKAAKPAKSASGAERTYVQ
jgi:hypothetical protein